MRHRLLRGLLLVAAAGAAACGGSSRPTTPVTLPTAPTGLPAGAVLGIVSGETGNAVTDALVVVAGRTYEADAQGQVTLAVAAPFGSLVDVSASGFLDRQTLLRQNATARMSLWPRQNARGIDEVYTRTLVYTAGTIEGAAPGSTPLLRLRLGTTQVIVVPSAEVRQDGAASAAHEAGVAAMNAAVGGRVAYVLAPAKPAAGVVFETRIDPADRICQDNPRAFAYTRISIQAGEVVGGEIIYCAIDAARLSTVTHELGHTFGLQHSPLERELMAPVFIPRFVASDFGARETLTMALLLERRGGNRFPDNDRDALQRGSGSVTIICR